MALRSTTMRRPISQLVALGITRTGNSMAYSWRVNVVYEQRLFASYTAIIFDRNGSPTRRYHVL